MQDLMYSHYHGGSTYPPGMTLEEVRKIGPGQALVAARLEALDVASIDLALKQIRSSTESIAASLTKLRDTLIEEE